MYKLYLPFAILVEIVAMYLFVVFVKRISHKDVTINFSDFKKMVGNSDTISDNEFTSLKRYFRQLLASKGKANIYTVIEDWCKQSVVAGTLQNMLIDANKAVTSARKYTAEASISDTEKEKNVLFNNGVSPDWDYHNYTAVLANARAFDIADLVSKLDAFFDKEFADE